MSQQRVLKSMIASRSALAGIVLAGMMSSLALGRTHARSLSSRCCGVVQRRNGDRVA